MNKEKENITINKSIFAVGLIAIFLSMYQFRDELNSIIIQGSGKSSISLFAVIVVFCFLLIISVYLYALNYIKYSFKENIQGWFIFKAIIFLANLFYFLAMFFPLLVFIIAIINILNIPIKNILIFDIIGVLILGVFGIISAIASYRNRNN